MVKSDRRVDVSLSANPRAAAPSTGAQREERPFVVAVFGDFGASEETGAEPRLAAERRFVKIDRDNFDAVLAKFSVQCDVPLGRVAPVDDEIRVRLTIRSLEDFHPDRIVQQLPPLRALLHTRRALDDPARFEAVAAEVTKWAAPESPALPTETPSTPPRAIAPSRLLDLILDADASSSRQREQGRWPGDLDRFLQKIVQPHLVKIDTSRQATLVAAIDRALSQAVRSVLHHPAFQRVEAAWRSLYRLVTTVESDVSFKIQVAQLTREELLQDLTAGEAAEDSILVRLLLDPSSTPASQPISLVLANYQFAHSGDEVILLRWLGAVAQQLRAPCVAAASPQLFDTASFTEMPSANDLRARLQEAAHQEWLALRRCPEAHWLVLALPRVLCRLPYGSETEPAESFAFEEEIGGQHDRLLWGNPAFAVGAVIAGAFATEGWSLDLSLPRRLEGLPLYVRQQDDVAVATPCAEVVLNDHLVEVLEDAGLVPLASHRNANTVAVPSVQSLGEPRAPLSWRL